MFWEKTQNVTGYKHILSFQETVEIAMDRSATILLFKGVFSSILFKVYKSLNVLTKITEGYWVQAQFCLFKKQ